MNLKDVAQGWSGRSGKMTLDIQGPAGTLVSLLHCQAPDGLSSTMQVTRLCDSGKRTQGASRREAIAQNFGEFEFPM